LGRRDGTTCAGAAFTTDEMWRHLETKQHYGEKLDHSKSFPFGIRACGDKTCVRGKPLLDFGK
jgi:hypothetical protein